MKYLCGTSGDNFNDHHSRKALRKAVSLVGEAALEVYGDGSGNVYKIDGMSFQDLTRMRFVDVPSLRQSRPPAIRLTDYSDKGDVLLVHEKIVYGGMHLRVTTILRRIGIDVEGNGSKLLNQARLRNQSNFFHPIIGPNYESSINDLVELKNPIKGV